MPFLSQYREETPSNSLEKRKRLKTKTTEGKSEEEKHPLAREILNFLPM